jgi:hypothetical protein
MKMLHPTVISFAFCVLTFASVAAQTVDDTRRQIREAGLEGIAGAMPENASLLGSFGFESLEKELPGIYGRAKQTFRLAAEHWDKDRNAGKTPDEPREELGHTLRLMLRNQFLYQVEAFLPDMARSVYSEDDRKRIKELLLGTPPPADGSLQTPNNRLAKHFEAYLKDLLVLGIREPQPIFERLLGTLDKRGEGAPLGGGIAPKWGRMSIAIKNAGTLVPSVKINIKYLRLGIGGHEQTDTFNRNPGIYVVPTGKWSVTAEAKGFASQTQGVEIKEGELTTLAFTLATTAGAGVPGAPQANRRAASARSLDPLSPGELALIGHYQRSGAVVVNYDPQALSRAWQALPENYPDLLRPHSSLLAIQLNPRGGRSVFASDMTGKPANPALNDPRLMVKLESVRNGQPVENSSQAAKFTEDIVWCVSQWVNAMRNLTEISFEPLSSIQVNDAFFSRVEARYWTEDPKTSTERVRWKHYVAWNRGAWDAAARSSGAPNRFFSADPSGEVADLTVKLIYGSRGRKHGRFLPSDASHRGVIEIYMGEGTGDVLPQAEFASDKSAAKYSFRRIFCHEFGHYLGLRHLPNSSSPAEETIFANGAMSRAYTLIGDGVLPVDAMMLTHVSNLSLDVRGRRCEGLVHEPGDVP